MINHYYGRYIRRNDNQDDSGGKGFKAYTQGPCGFGCLQGGVWEGGQCAGGNTLYVLKIIEVKEMG